MTVASVQSLAKVIFRVGCVNVQCSGLIGPPLHILHKFRTKDLLLVHSQYSIRHLIPIPAT